MSKSAMFTQEQLDALNAIEKLASSKLPDAIELFRWDVLAKKFLPYLCDLMGMVDTVIDKKEPTKDCGLNAIQLKTEDRE